MPVIVKEKTRNVFMFSSLFDETTESVIEDLLELANESNEPINLIINSGGGVVSDGFSIIDTMNSISAPVNTIVSGTAASMAAVVASAGNKRFITENSRTMIHQISGGAFGNINEIVSDVKQMEETNEKMLKILAKSTGKTVKELKEDTDGKDLWLNAEKAIEYGLVDKMIDNEKMKDLNITAELKSLSKTGNKSIGTVVDESLPEKNLEKGEHQAMAISEEVHNKVLTEKAELTTESATLKTEKAELVTEVAALKETNKGLTEKVDAIEASKNLTEKETAFSKLLEEAKVSPAIKETVLEKFKTAEEMTAFYKDAAPIVVTEEVGDGGQEETALSKELTAEEKELVDSGDYTEKEVLGFRKYSQ